MHRETIKREIDISLSNQDKDKEYINKLKITRDKVKYLRFVKKYTQMESAKMIGITERQIQRVEKSLKMSGLCRENVV